MRAVQAAGDPATGRTLVERRLRERFALRTSANLISSPEIEAIRARIIALPPVPQRANLERADLLAGVTIFVIVVAATLPVVLPFAFIADVGAAKHVSRAVALAMLFFGGLALGRYAGYGSWKAGFTMVGLGTGLVIVINALGG
jgi:VIT1/CCC1 family predicted Fe2+/Mn2+ transporter